MWSDQVSDLVTLTHSHLVSLHQGTWRSSSCLPFLPWFFSASGASPRMEMSVSSLERCWMSWYLHWGPRWIWLSLGLSGGSIYNIIKYISHQKYYTPVAWLCLLPGLPVDGSIKMSVDDHLVSPLASPWDIIPVSQAERFTFKLHPGAGSHLVSDNAIHS